MAHKVFDKAEDVCLAVKLVSCHLPGVELVTYEFSLWGES